MTLDLRTAPVSHTTQEVSLVGLSSITIRGFEPTTAYYDKFGWKRYRGAGYWKDIVINKPSRLYRRKDGKVTIKSHTFPDETITIYGSGPLAFKPLMARVNDKVITEFIL